MSAQDVTVGQLVRRHRDELLDNIVNGRAFDPEELFRRAVEAGIKLGEARGAREEQSAVLVWIYGRASSVGHEFKVLHRELVRGVHRYSYPREGLTFDPVAEIRAQGARENADKLRTAISENEMLQRQLGAAEGRIKELTAQSESWRLAHQAWQRWGDSLRPASVLNGDEPTREWIESRLRSLETILATMTGKTDK